MSPPGPLELSARLGGCDFLEKRSFFLGYPSTPPPYELLLHKIFDGINSLLGPLVTEIRRDMGSAIRIWTRLAPRPKYGPQTPYLAVSRHQQTE